MGTPGPTPASAAATRRVGFNSSEVSGRYYPVERLCPEIPLEELRHDDMDFDERLSSDGNFYGLDSQYSPSIFQHGCGYSERGSANGPDQVLLRQLVLSGEDITPYLQPQGTSVSFATNVYFDEDAPAEAAECGEMAVAELTEEGPVEIVEEDVASENFQGCRRTFPDQFTVHFVGGNLEVFCRVNSDGEPFFDHVTEATDDI